MDRYELKVGGYLTLIGGVVGFVVNIFHPTPPWDPEQLLRIVATRPHWLELHFFAMGGWPTQSRNTTTRGGR